MKPIEMVDLSVMDASYKEDIMKAISRVIDSQRFIGGEEVRSFQEAFQETIGLPHVVPCGNGTDALQIALMAYDFPKGSEVICPAFSYAATVEVILLLGLSPVYVDVEEGSFNIDVSKIEEKITDKTVAIMPVHLYGLCADMIGVNRIAEKHGLKVIEDAAQAVGSGMNMPDGSRKACGALGDVAGFSFFPSKNLGAYGDGGAISTSSESLYEKLRKIANHGQDALYKHSLIGVNSRLDAIQAAILGVKLGGLKGQIARRQEIARKYDLELGEIDGLKVPHKQDHLEHVYHQYTIRVRQEDRLDLQKNLQENGISSRIYYPLPLPLQQAYENGQKEQDFKIALKLSDTVLSLPVHPGLTDEEVRFVIESIKNFYKRR